VVLLVPSIVWLLTVFIRTVSSTLFWAAYLTPIILALLPTAVGKVTTISAVPADVVTVYKVSTAAGERVAVV